MSRCGAPSRDGNGVRASASRVVGDVGDPAALPAAPSRGPTAWAGRRGVPPGQISRHIYLNKVWRGSTVDTPAIVERGAGWTGG